jgi:hypothetical protein
MALALVLLDLEDEASHSSEDQLSLFETSQYPRQVGTEILEILNTYHTIYSFVKKPLLQHGVCIVTAWSMHRLQHGVCIGYRMEYA